MIGGYRIICPRCGVGFIDYNNSHCTSCGSYYNRNNTIEFNIKEDSPEMVIESLNESIQSEYFEGVPFKVEVHALRMQRATNMIEKLYMDNQRLVSDKKYMARALRILISTFPRDEEELYKNEHFYSTLIEKTKNLIKNMEEVENEKLNSTGV